MSVNLNLHWRMSLYCELCTYLIENYIYIVYHLNHPNTPTTTPTTSAHTGNQPREKTSSCSSHWKYWIPKLNICLDAQKSPPLLLNFCLVLASLFCWSLSHVVPMECMLEIGGIMGSNLTCSYTEICSNLTRLASEEIKRWQSDKATWVLTTEGIPSLSQGNHNTFHACCLHLPQR